MDFNRSYLIENLIPLTGNNITEIQFNQLYIIFIIMMVMDFFSYFQSPNHDDKPIAGVGDKKSFEDMIEEQLRQEQEKVIVF